MFLVSLNTDAKWFGGDWLEFHRAITTETVENKFINSLTFLFFSLKKQNKNKCLSKHEGCEIFVLR